MKISEKNLRKLVLLEILKEQYQPRDDDPEESPESPEGSEENESYQVNKRVEKAIKKASTSTFRNRKFRSLLNKLQTVTVPLYGNKTIDFKLDPKQPTSLHFTIKNIVTSPKLQNINLTGKVDDLMKRDPKVSLRISGRF